MAVMIAGFEEDIAWLLQEVMHKRLAGVPVWRIDVLKTPFVTVDIGLIRAPRVPHPEVQPLGENLVAPLEQDQAAKPTTSETTDTTSVESISGGSTTLISFRLAPSATLVPLSRVKKLKDQMDTLLYHIQPWLQRSIAEVEEGLERKMAHHCERKVMEAFVKILREDLDTILEARVKEFEALSTEPAEDTMLDALFSTTDVPQNLPREHAKRHRLEIRIIPEIERRSAIYAERSTTNGTVITEDIIDAVPTYEGAGSGKPDTPTC
ncbi:hypothetical protein EJD97_004146 [Solanum chilense]|uniref:Integrase core domain containing protein n=1 Tax=Solanum chilense TaxID=4083 RepID=A0A6N2BZR4_SOLCI|nr:hypothetical protein EJD97_004146 [Solanum chilense]